MLEVVRIGGLELRFLQSSETSGGSLDLFEMIVQPNANMPVPHYHQSWDETIYGLSGITTWSIDGRDIAVGPGETVFIRRGVVHGFRNDGAAPASCLVVLTPGALAGIAMDIGIDPTVRHAADLGFIPVVIADACGAGHKDAAERSLEALKFAGDAIITDVAAFRAALASR